MGDAAFQGGSKQDTRQNRRQDMTGHGTRPNARFPPGIWRPWAYASVKSIGIRSKQIQNTDIGPGYCYFFMYSIFFRGPRCQIRPAKFERMRLQSSKTKNALRTRAAHGRNVQLETIHFYVRHKRDPPRNQNPRETKH